MTSKRTKLMSGFVALLMLVSMCAMFVLPASAGENAGGIVAEKGLVDATGYPDITTYSDSVKVYSIKVFAKIAIINQYILIHIHCHVA